MKSNIFIGTVLLIISLLWRGYFGLTHVAFSQDQARDVALMQTYRDANYVFIPYGPKASVGNFYLAPLYYQIMYWLYILTQNELSMQYLTIILESTTPVILYVALSKVFPKSIAFMSALTYLFSTQITIFGTIMWNPNLIPFLSSIVLLSAVQLSNKNNSSWYILPGILAVVAAIHFHYQGVVLVPFIVLIILNYLKNKRDIVPLAAASIVACMSFGAYIAAEIQYNWPNTTAIINYATKDHSKIYDRVTKPEFLTTFIPSFVERTLVGATKPYLWLGRLIWLGGLSAIVVHTYINRKRLTPSLWFAAYIITILTMLRLYKGDKLDFYLGTLYLLPAVLLAYIGSLNQKVALILAVVCMYISGQWLNKQADYNAFQSINAMCQTLPKETEIRPIFYDQDKIQFIAYCKKKGYIKLDSDAKMLAEICSPHRFCGDNVSIQCTGNPTHNLRRLTKQAAGYNQTEIKEFSNIKIIYGSTTVPISQISTNPSKELDSNLPNNPIPMWMHAKFTGNTSLF